MTAGTDISADIQSKGFAAKWLGGWAGMLLIASTTVVVLYCLYLFYPVGSEEHKSLVSNVISVILYIGPSILAWRASRCETLSARTRSAWRFISLANVAFGLGGVLWIYFENYLGEQPFPSWADLGYLSYYPLMMAGLLLLVEKMRSAEEKLTFALDAGVVMIVGGMVLWYFLLRQIASAADEDTLKTVLSLAYPLSDLVLLLGISSLLLRRTASASRDLANILLLGMCVNFAADFIFAYQNLLGTYVTGSPVDALFSIPAVPVMIAAHIQYVRASQPALETADAGLSISRFFWVPYLAIVVDFFLLFKVAFEGDTDLLVQVLLMSAAVAGMVIFRQFMFVRENTKANAALTEMQERIQGIYSASTDAIGLADFSGRITEVNDSFVLLTGYRRDEIIGSMNYHDFVPDDYLEKSFTPDMAVGERRPIEYERELVRKDGTARNVTTTLFAVSGRDGSPAAMAVVIRDITDRRSLEKQLTYQALHDPLTGLANRSLLSERVTAALSRSRRQRTNIALLFLDLDNFKTVNDTMGHAAGDSLLVTVSERLRSCLRASDTPARLGGDEFAVLVEDIKSPGEEIAVANRILTAIRTPVQIGEKEAFVGASIGIATSLSSVVVPQDLLRNADVAMYAAKREGKNRYSVYEDAMHAEVVKRAKLESELRLAIERNEFEVYFQPILDIAGSYLVGMEALVRWNHPRGERIGPDKFIPIAEESNLIGPLGQWVLDEACFQAARWQTEYCPKDPFVLSVNISGRQFADPAFVQNMEASYAAAGLAPENLILEITESTMLFNTDATIEKLNQIKKLGVKLAIDDFGTGYSSLSYLNMFPIDVLKIDRAFVEKLSTGDEGAAMAKAIISMSETLHLTTIAEGIESLEQKNLLRGLNCNWGQGYYFAKPLSSREMDRFLSRAYGRKEMEHPGSKAVAEAAGGLMSLSTLR